MQDFCIGKSQMSGKFYAVKMGREPGIYLSWARAQVHVNGYPGGIFESFKTMSEARRYMGWPAEEMKDEKPKVVKLPKSEGVTKVVLSDDPKIVEIFTDGSHQRKSDYLGIGAWCRYQSADYELSARVTREVLRSYGIADDTNPSNPTAEFIAFANILERLVPIRFTGVVRFYIDYNGVERWMLGQQKAKAPHIVKIRDHCLRLLKDVTFRVEYVHVKAHSGVQGNEHADKLAGNKNEIDTFSLLLTKLPV